jgi:hypothetical protein
MTDERRIVVPMPPEERAEAISWLTANENPEPFATNRFRTKEGAKAFFEEVMAAGASRILVQGDLKDQRRIASEGGPYADTLIIELPQDKDHRKKLFALAAKEAKREGFAPVKDSGQTEIPLWWD